MERNLNPTLILLTTYPTDPQGPDHHWDGWFGPSGRNETAPETSLKVIIEMILNSTVAKAVSSATPDAYQNLTSVRKDAEVRECVD